MNEKFSVNEIETWLEKWPCEQFDGGAKHVAWAIILVTIAYVNMMTGDTRGSTRGCFYWLPCFAETVCGSPSPYFAISYLKKNIAVLWSVSKRLFTNWLPSYYQIAVSLVLARYGLRFDRWLSNLTTLQHPNSKLRVLRDLKIWHRAD